MSVVAKSIYGPPGTGKTTHVLGLIKKMVDSGEDARGISFLSFTRAAANEALRRMNMKKNDNVCTIHALCYRLLKLSPQMVMDTAKMKVLCDDAGFSMGFESFDKTEYDFYLAMSQYSRNALIDLDEAYSVCGGHGSLAELYSFHDTYTKWKEAYGVVDFDDMVDSVVKNRLYPRIKHLIVDEAQDLTPLQWKAIDSFSMVRGIGTVTIAGDDDQNVYKFSGADPGGMPKFEERFDAEREVLSVSWRVPRTVHAVAQGIIGRVEDRVPKEYSPRDEDGSVSMVAEFEPSDLKADAPVMVLGRTNHVLKKFAQGLREEGIRYTWQNEGGSWKRDAGLSIRVWKKLQAGEDVSTREYNVLAKVLTLDAKKAVNARRLDVFKRHWSEVMVLPPEAIEQIEVHGEDALTSVPSVELYTIHGAKGKECDNVILLTELTDRVRDGMDSDPDVEARVFYVGVTRAMTNLTIVGGYDGYPIY